MKLQFPFSHPKYTKYKLALIPICILLFIAGVFWMNWKLEERLKLFPAIKTEFDINGKVMEILLERGNAEITLENGARYTVTFARNYLYNPYDIGEFLMKGDLFIKHPNSDTIKIVRNEEIYLFVLSKELNR
ncbi:MAG TPA: hypothetical protein PLV21_07660 [Cyclobacteriaceae bacterium]|nr:hypothetical protein [Cyclobacteriaceae bacterium]HRJ81741.1 hypothetical protein [Cyclobacteriaceae bacterium]